MLTVQLALHTSDLTSLLAGDGILDTTNEKAAQVQATLRVVATVAAVGLFIMRAWQTRFAAAAMLITALMAGVFVWVVFNITTLQDRVDNEINAAAAVSGDATGQLHPTGVPAPPAGRDAPFTLT